MNVRLSFCLLACGISFLAAANADDDAWPQYGLNAQHTCYNKSETILTAANVSRLELAWRSPSLPGFPSDPILAQGLVFIGAGDGIHALDEHTGKQVWQKPTCSGQIAGPPAFSEGMLFVPDAGGYLAAYDASTGRQIWCTKISASPIYWSATVHNGDVLISNGAEAYVLDKKLGTIRWSFTPPNNDSVGQIATISDGTIFVPTSAAADSNGYRAQFVFALDTATGQQLWQVYLGSAWQGGVSLSVNDGVVYASASTVGLFALRARNGDVIWKYDADEELIDGIGGTPALGSGRVFVGVSEPTSGIAAFDAATGAYLWSGSAADEVGDVTVANDVVYAIDDFGVFTMTNARTGAPLKHFGDGGLPPYFGSNPIVANGTVYVLRGTRVDAFRLPNHGH